MKPTYFLVGAIAFVAASFLPLAHAASSSPDTVGALMAREAAGALEWQRIRLEDRIQERVKEAVAPTVPHGAFVVNVKVELKPRPKIEAEASKPKKPKPAKDPRREALEKAAKDAPGTDDRITLSKLDLDAPLFPEDEKEKADADEAADDDDTATEAPVVEPDLFSSIQSVTIGVLYDKSMPDSKKDIIQRIVTESVGQFGDVTPVVTVDKVDLLPPAPPEKKIELPPEKPEKPWDLKRWIVEFKTAIGMFMASLVVAGLMTFIIGFVFMGYRGLKSREIAIMEAKNAREEAQSQAAAQAAQDERDRGDGSRGGDAPETEGELTGMVGAPGAAHADGSGFEKFKSLLKDSPERAAMLIKQWTKAPARGAGDALAALPAVLATEQFVQIFKFLSVEDRQAWKRVLASRVDTVDTATADVFITSQIVDNFLVSLPPMDEELKAALSNLTMEEAVELASADPRLGAMLATLLPTNQVAAMYSKLDPDRANGVTLSSLKFSDEEIRRGFPSLKAAILKVRGKKGRIPFLDKAVELLAGIEPAKEPYIFNAIAESGDWGLLETSARLFFPSELIPRLPDRALKACLERLPLVKRAEVIASLDDELRLAFMGACGREGSKARELIDVEVQELLADEAKRRKLTRNRGELWRQFTDTVRGLMRTSEAVADLAAPVMDAWLHEKSGGRIGGVDEQQAA